MKSIFNDRFHIGLGICLLFFALIGLWIRLLPMEYLLSGIEPVVSMTDPWYTVRQVEQILHHFPAYSWYDPMLSYPMGKVIDWGPVFPLMVSSVVWLLGATNQSDIIRIISWIPPILGLILIPICYMLGKLAWNKEAGYLSAILISVLGGETLFRSFYGYVDHHILEVLLTSLFFICYFYLLKNLKSTKNHISDEYDHQCLVCNYGDFLPALIGGLIYYLAIMTIPTCTLIAGIVGVITLFLPLVIHNKEDFLKILKIHAIIFGFFIILFGISGIHVPGVSFSQYSIVHLLAPFLIILESLLLYLLMFPPVLSNRIYYYAIFGVIGIGLLFGLNVSAPDIIGSLMGTLKGTLGFGISGVTIDEMQPSDPVVVLLLFNIASAFAIFGFYQIFKKFIQFKEPLYLGLCTWGIGFFVLSMLVTRYLYYSGIVVVLFAGIGLSELYRRMITSNSPSDKRKSDKRINNVTGNKSNKSIIIVGILIGIITILSIPVASEVAHKETQIASIDLEWIDPLLWLKDQNSSGLDYYSIYSKSDFTYPENASTIISSWEYGHWILALSHKIIVTSPFEDNMGSVAKYFLSESDEEAEKIAGKFHGQYIITTNKLLFNDIPTLFKWISLDLTIDPYYFIFYSVPNQKSQILSPMIGLKSAFFNTTLVKLHVNDGSFIPANTSVLVSYRTTTIENQEVPVMKNLLPLNLSQTQVFLSQKQPNQEVVSLKYTSPITDTPALQNYRLIYESNGTRTFPGDVTLNNIKIFERVKGYTIPGTGTIEVPIITNQGRHFTYRQQSENGTFTLPYATTNSPYDVRATGPYRIIETNQTFDVDESQIEKYYT
ncbi:oligosaccharyl transferase, archaeosortase A system-associated [Methanospirillum hungatei]|uniref:oligosaccharyl transferase, archaeosortase A system-associated n=1 Tax=Methanospirillum hungatei TaxID=2203 RepID=UPI0026EC688C|nr:oligosaccharyl transferase, archaeosortase A system-associated [Methanospirillum hungatei]MCA1916839.1 oligosaccharyl transferase, archaeosortase A system-associated [Methanospirillum hungatei]